MFLYPQSEHKQKEVQKKTMRIESKHVKKKKSEKKIARKERGDKETTRPRTITRGYSKLLSINNYLNDIKKI